MSISSETRNTVRPELQQLDAAISAMPMSFEEGTEHFLVKHMIACFQWLVEQRNWGTAIRNGKVTYASVEDFIWQSAANEDFMLGITREVHAAAFAADLYGAPFN